MKSAVLTRELLELLACPGCKGELALLDEEDALACLTCAVKYPVREGIPVLLVDEAEKLP